MKGLFLEGLIFGGAYLRWEICVSKSIGLAFQLEGNLPFLLCFTLYLRAFNKGFFALRVWGAYIWRGLLSEFYGMLTSTENNIDKPLFVVVQHQENNR